MREEAVEIPLPRGMSLKCPPQSRTEVRFIMREVFLERTYVQHGVEIRDGDRIFDVGANIGLFSLFAAYQARDLEVHCFEPVAPTRAVLEENVAQFEGREGCRFHVHDHGLSDHDGELEIEYYPRAPGNSSAYPSQKRAESRDLMNGLTLRDAWDWHRPIAVGLFLVYPFRQLASRLLLKRALSGSERLTCRVERLSSVIEREDVERIDLLKVDVEGSELDVLAGIDEAHWPRIRQLVLEGSPANSNRVAGLKELLADLGFEVAAETVGQRPIEESPIPWTLYATRD